MRKRHAFTLIEMLVVIAIIAIVATLVVNGSRIAKTKQRESQVKASLYSIKLMIDSYKSKLNFYPPDNGNLVSTTGNFAVYDALAATNPLLYELVGATNNYPIATQILLFGNTPSNSIPTDISFYSGVYNRNSVNNGNSDEPHNFYQHLPSSKDYFNYATNGAQMLAGLVVPVDGPAGLNVPNFWHYDSSTTNRHNPESYDLWAEYVSASRDGSNIITTIGNW
jgi:prepilin-type N-terminal cleavage/methylation domain-containing protein